MQAPSICLRYTYYICALDCVLCTSAYLLSCSEEDRDMGCCSHLRYIIPILAVGIYCLRQYNQGGECTSTARIDGKTVIVTGANTGVGKVTTEELVRRGGRVIMACRSLERCSNAEKDIKNHTGATEKQLRIMKLDLGSLKSVRLFAEEFLKTEKRLDILINNAGVFGTPYTKTEDGFEHTFGVNHLGHFLLTNLLVDMLKKSAPSRIVTVSSDGYKFTTELDFDNLMADSEESYGKFAEYSKSKLANILFSRELSKRLKGTGVNTYSIHPGTFYSEMGRNIYVPIASDIFEYLAWPLFKDTWHGAQTQICCAISEEFANDSGKYYADCVEKIPSEQALDDDTAKKLWDVSMKLVGLTN